MYLILLNSKTNFQKKTVFIIPMIVISIIELCIMALFVLGLLLGTLLFHGFLKSVIAQRGGKNKNEEIAESFMYTVAFLFLALNILLICKLGTQLYILFSFLIWSYDFIQNSNFSLPCVWILWYYTGLTVHFIAVLCSLRKQMSEDTRPSVTYDGV